VKHLKRYKKYESSTLDYDFEVDSNDHGYYKMDGELKDILNIITDDGAVLSMHLADELMIERGSMSNEGFIKALKEIFKRMDNDNLLYNDWEEATYIKHAGGINGQGVRVQTWEQYRPEAHNFDSFVK